MTKRSVTKKPKLTKWFDGSVKPVRDGVYQRKSYFKNVAFWIFKEGTWKYGGFDSVSQCVAETGGKDSQDQNRPWRGLAKNPEVQP